MGGPFKQLIFGASALLMLSTAHAQTTKTPILEMAPGTAAFAVTVDDQKKVKLSFGIIQSVGETVRLIQRTEMRMPCAFVRAEDAEVARSDLTLLPDPNASSAKDFSTLAVLKYVASAVLAGAEPPEDQKLCATLLAVKLHGQRQYGSGWGGTYRAPMSLAEGKLALVAAGAGAGVIPSFGSIHQQDGKTFLKQWAQTEPACAVLKPASIDISDTTVIMLSDPKASASVQDYGMSIMTDYTVASLAQGKEIDEAQQKCLVNLLLALVSQRDMFAKDGAFAGK